MSRVCIVLPCCKTKEGSGSIEAAPINIASGKSIEKNDRLVLARSHIDAQIDLNSDLVPAVRLYSGKMYSPKVQDSLIEALHNPEIDIVYFSGGYGLVHSTTPIQKYECKMEGLTYRKWLDHNLDIIVADYLIQQNPTYIIGYFPKSTDYHDLFTRTARAIDVMSRERNLLLPTLFLFTVANGSTGSTLKILAHKIIETIESLGGAYTGNNYKDITRVGRFLDDHMQTVVDGVRVISIDANTWEEPSIHSPNAVDKLKMEEIRESKPSKSVIPPKAKDFKAGLFLIFNEYESIGEKYVVVEARYLHKLVGGYPKINRMPVCCTVMKNMMGPDDVVLCSPPSGKGATLKIRYKLPRAMKI